MNIEKEILKSNSVIEAAGYLRYLTRSHSTKAISLRKFKEAKQSLAVGELIDITPYLIASIILGALRFINEGDI